MGEWDQNGPYGDWLVGCGVNSPCSGQGSLAGCYECSGEPSGSGATELVSYTDYTFYGVTYFYCITLIFLLQWYSLK
jgi:hypothetical protein